MSVNSSRKPFFTKRSTIIGAASLCLLGAVVFADYWTSLPADLEASFVGRSACVDCHQEEAKLYSGSHHDLAMDLATDETVIADFSGVELEHYGITSRMFRDGDRFMINTEGPDGQMTDFEIKYVFGVDPLQQYMVEFDRSEGMQPNEVGRLQVLRVSWDTQKKEWFYLEPPDVREKLAPDDDLHWTGIAQRWNTMCAECHSTNLRKNFDDKEALYHTSWSEIDVSCEACHGAGSIHVELAKSKSLFWDRHHGYGLAKLKGTDSIAQIETCAPCHSRRRVLNAGFQPGDRFCDFYEPELLNETTYHANGEILDEVYVYGSFIQSKMFHKGIRCSDCHDPHSLKLKMPGNQTCTSCHAHPAGKYDTPSHHKHEPGTAGASCVECHMPETTYMAVDPRRDHSIRIPRPDLSAKHETPNACTGCHVELEAAKTVNEIKQRFPKLAEFVQSENDAEFGELKRLKEYSNWLEQGRNGNTQIKELLAEIDRWSDDACEQWYGEQRKTKEHYASAIDNARKQQPGALKELAKVVLTEGDVPDIARATALEELRRRSAGKSVLQVAREALNDANPIVRAAAIRAFEDRDPGQLRRAVLPFLSDDSRLVRTEAARLLAAVSSEDLTLGQREKLNAALDEFHEGLMVSNDRAGAHLSWAVLLETQGRFDEAVGAYKTAMRVQPNAVGPRSNLASLLERMIGMNQVRQDAIIDTSARVSQLRKDELPLLERDANLAPDNGPLQHRLGLLLYLNKQIEPAIDRLRRSVKLEPENDRFLMALVLLLETAGKMDEAIDRCRDLIRLAPANPQYSQLLGRLNASRTSGGK